MSQEEVQGGKGRIKRIAIFILKVAISVLAFWWVSRKIDLQASLKLLTKADPIYLLLGILVFNVSKIISTFRILALLKSIGKYITVWQNLKLYYIGAFYNIFLPGSMGGDAYKVILLKQITEGEYRKMTSTVFLDRGSGMAILVMITLLMLPMSSFTADLEYAWPMAIGVSVLMMIGFYIFIRLFFKNFRSAFASINLYSIGTQLTQVLTAYLLMLSLSINSELFDHLVLFMVSGVVSVVPLTIGGFGARELAFQWGSEHSNINLESAVAFTLLFFLVTLISSVVGSVFVLERQKARV